MKLVIVPNYISKAINDKIDEAIKAQPDAEKDRQYFYDTLLAYFDEHGALPDFKVVKK